MRPLIVVCGVAAVLSVAIPLSARQAQERTIYVSVVDRQGRPVPEIKLSDVFVTEDGRPRQLVKIEQAAPPLNVAIVP